jgi:hypothetical protein
MPKSMLVLTAGPAAAGKWTGMQNCLGNIAGIVVGPLTGFIVDRTGHFRWALAPVPASQCWAEFHGSNWLAPSSRPPRAQSLTPPQLPRRTRPEPLRTYCPHSPAHVVGSRLSEALLSPLGCPPAHKYRLAKAAAVAEARRFNQLRCAVDD